MALSDNHSNSSGNQHSPNELTIGEAPSFFSTIVNPSALRIVDRGHTPGSSAIVTGDAFKQFEGIPFMNKQVHAWRVRHV